MGDKTEKWSRRANRGRGNRIRALQKERPGGPDTGTICPAPCGKMRFASRKMARQAGRQMQSDGRHEPGVKRTYPCLFGPWYHLTSADAATVEFIRDQMARRAERGDGEG
jgi:hypothetical protein